MRSNSSGVTGMMGTSRISCSAIVSSFLRRLDISRVRPGTVSRRGMPALLMFVLLDIQRDLVVIGHLWIRISHARQVSEPGTGVQKTNHGIIAILFLELRDAALRVEQVPEHDRLCRAGLGAGRSDHAIRHAHIA